MDRLTAMQVFVEVSEWGSLVAASDTLDMSRARVSLYLASLETWLAELTTGAGRAPLHRTQMCMVQTEDNTLCPDV